MNNYEKILENTKKNNGYITAHIVNNLGINSTYLSNLVNDKKLERLD